MSDKTNPMFSKSICVEVNREEPLLFWSKHFRVSPLNLRQAVRLVGPRVEDVSEFLGRRKRG